MTIFHNRVRTRQKIYIAEGDVANVEGNHPALRVTFNIICLEIISTVFIGSIVGYHIIGRGKIIAIFESVFCDVYFLTV